MTVELISVGTELLLGNIVNTNAAYLAEMRGSGIVLLLPERVGDNERETGAVIESGAGRSDLYILSGGLGPTRTS